MSVFGQLRGTVRRGLLAADCSAGTLAVAGASPFLFAVYDDACPDDLVEAAADAFPPQEWPGWIGYSSPGEKKLAANSKLPEPCLKLLDSLNALCPPWLQPDQTLYAAGISMMPPGGWLDVHLDASVHPKTGFRRAVNLILFIDDWQHRWGGALELWDADAARCLTSVYPRRNRLVAFECNDRSYHGIPTPIDPFATWRRTLSVFFYDPRAERLRANFVGPPDPEKDAWRNERSCML